jgi:hypothetical protein
MLSSLKKTSDKSAASLVPPWHPNFRNFERLPDTKAVRTTFFVNGIAILATVSLAIYFIYNEVERSTLISDLEAAKVIVSERKPLSDSGIVQYKKFQEEEKRVQELQAFLSAPKIEVSELLIELGSSLPPATVLTAVEYRAAGVMIRGGIGGSAEEGAGKAVAYVEQIRKHPYFSTYFDPVVLSSIVRDPGTGEMRFEIDLTFKAPALAKGGKK